MTYDVLLVARAEADVDRIIGYLAKRSPQGAVTWCERWQEVLVDLSQQPLNCGAAPESSAYETRIRQALFKTRRGRTYRALFTIVGRGVYILHVRGPRQDLIRGDSRRRR